MERKGRIKGGRWSLSPFHQGVCVCASRHACMYVCMCYNICCLFVSFGCVREILNMFCNCEQQHPCQRVDCYVFQTQITNLSHFQILWVWKITPISSTRRHPCASPPCCYDIFSLEAFLDMCWPPIAFENKTCLDTKRRMAKMKPHPSQINKDGRLMQPCAVWAESCVHIWVFFNTIRITHIWDPAGKIRT